MSAHRISLLLPTRGRRRLAERFFESVAQKTSRLDSVEIIIYVDEHDTDSHPLHSGEINIKKIIGPRISMGSYNSVCLRQSSGDIVILVNDDVIIRTENWDEQVRALDSKIEDKIYLTYGNDLFKVESVCAFPIISRRTCEILSDPFPADYTGAFIDYHLLDIFKRLERLGAPRIFYMGDVIFEHMHFRAGKGEMDETYRARDRFGDDNIFLRLRNIRSSSAAKLAKVLGLAHAKKTLTHPPAANEQNASLLGATVLDKALPLAWRPRLFFWFLARFATRWADAHGDPTRKRIPDGH